MNPADAPLDELDVDKKGSVKKFVVVEESRLKELTLLENSLRQEKVKLGEQCLELIHDVNMSARIPVPAMRLAVHNMCESRMREAARDQSNLITDWISFAKKSGYDKPHVYLTKSFANNAPLAERALKLKLTREAANGWRVRCDRDTMIFEDSLGQLNRAYFEAQQRRRDYDRYFILATRYGVFSQEEFSRDASPGDRYFNKVTEAAKMLQKRWDLYWPMKKLRMHRAARFMQTLFRSYIARKKYYPIIKIRLKYGTRTYYRFCWKRWIHYNVLVKDIRRLQKYHLNSYVRLCFKSWKQDFLDTKAYRREKMSKFVLRARSGSLWGIFLKWAEFAKYSRRVLRKARRLVQNPQFALWYDYAQSRKRKRQRHQAATIIEAVVKGYFERKRFKYKNLCLKRFAHFFRHVHARAIVRITRQKAHEIGFIQWLPGDLADRHQKALDKERRRLISCQQVVHEKESAAIADIRRHFKSHNGKIQIKEIILSGKKHSIRRKNVLQIQSQTAIVSAQGSPINCFGFLSRGRYIRNQIKKSLEDECSRVIRRLGVHDFNSKSPPAFKCFVAGCNTYFVSVEQYEVHLQNPAKHIAHDSSMARFHLLMKSVKVQELLRKYLGLKFGISTQVNCLDLWCVIQEWRRISIKTETYIHKAVAFYETYVRLNCPRPVHIQFESLPQLHEKMQIVLSREYEGFYRLSVAEPGFIKKLFGASGRIYEEWTTENIIPADLFDELECGCFKVLFSLYKAPSFADSVEGCALKEQLKAEEDERRIIDFEQYMKYSKNVFMGWATEFKALEKQINVEAGQFCEQILSLVLEEHVNATLDAETLSESRQRGYAEQIQYEQSKLLADDAFAWAEDGIYEAVYDFYANSIIKIMWAKPDCRKSLMEFAGYLEPKKSFMKKNWKDRKNVANDWFQEFFNNAVAEESKQLPLDSHLAAIRIQKLVRKRLGLKKVRKIFVATFGKRYSMLFFFHFFDIVSHEFDLFLFNDIA